MEGAVQNDIPGIDADCGGGTVDHQYGQWSAFSFKNWNDGMTKQLNI